jgi:hypothetical protein
VLVEQGVSCTEKYQEYNRSALEECEFWLSDAMLGSPVNMYTSEDQKQALLNLQASMIEKNQTKCTERGLGAKKK